MFFKNYSHYCYCFYKIHNFKRKPRSQLIRMWQEFFVIPELLLCWQVKSGRMCFWSSNSIYANNFWNSLHYLLESLYISGTLPHKHCLIERVLVRIKRGRTGRVRKWNAPSIKEIEPCQTSLAQWIERRTADWKVPGSILVKGMYFGCGHISSG